MKRTEQNPATPPTKRLTLRRESLRVLDEDALHQARGGRAGSSSKFAEQQVNNA